MSSSVTRESARPSSHPERRRGVLLVSVGTPDGQDVPAVRRFLAESLSDPLIVHLPAGLRWFQGAVGRWLARSRAPRLAESYRKIWSDRGSPQAVNLSDQASALAATLPDDWKVFVAMRYGQPAIADALRQIEADCIDELVVVPMYPQFSQTTTGTVVRELYRVLRNVGQHINVTTRTTWFDDVGYVNAQARLVAEYACSHGLRPQDTHLLFSAHGAAPSSVSRGDPYVQHVRRTVELVAERLGWPTNRLSLAFQGRLSPGEWLRPDTQGALAELSRGGEKQVLICPITFTVDCLETLAEIGVQYREAFEANGGELYVCPALNAYEPFIAALRSLVLRRPRSMTSERVTMMPLLTPKPEAVPCDSEPNSLLMIGVSLTGRLGSGRGPQLKHSSHGAFGRVRKSRKAVRGFLDWVREQTHAREAFVWNTCQRIEFYGWLADSDDSAARERIVGRIRRQLYGAESGGLEVNTLFGVDAWHHLMRTVSGLNSALPGDTDVVAQLQTACRMAERAGTAGPRATYLVQSAVELSHEVRAETSWGQFSPGYCLAALSHVHATGGTALDECRHVVIGGSATSRSILSTLSKHFQVPERQMNLIYRGHHGQLKLLRAAIGRGKRLRVQSYSERMVLQAIAEADLVYFGIDNPEPVLDAEALRDLRDFAKRPLTVVDFNSFGSLSGGNALHGITVWTEQELDQAVAEYADVMCARAEFAQAAEEVEQWIEDRLPYVAVAERIASHESQD